MTPIFSAEACAINMASSQNQGITNSLSFLIRCQVWNHQKNRKFDNPLIIKILCKLENLFNDVHICWVSSHPGISRNDQADKVARSALNITTEKNLR